MNTRWEPTNTGRDALGKGGGGVETKIVVLIPAFLIVTLISEKRRHRGSSQYIHISNKVYVGTHFLINQVDGEKVFFGTSFSIKTIFRSVASPTYRSLWPFI